ncbi:hypothetical protein GQ44DRAFT_620277, partial [Phaeosphaeriaceae sp. PMI808]
LKYVVYYFTYFLVGVPSPYYAWYSDLILYDYEMRSFIIAASNMFSYIMLIWYTIAVWRTADAPRFKAGFTTASTLGVAIIVLSLILRLLQSKDEKRREREETSIEDVEALGSLSTSSLQGDQDQAAVKKI